MRRRTPSKPRTPEELADFSALPGAATTCTLLTILTIMLAWLTAEPRADAMLRPLYFAALFAFFIGVGRRYRQIQGLPLRLVQAGFLVLTLGFAGGAVVLLCGWDVAYPVLAHLRLTLERGAGFLLGLTLISYGIILWIPQVLESHRILTADYTRTRGQLARSEKARSRMEMRFVEAERLGAVGELAAGVAHDLRNPLAIIKGTAESLRRRPREADEIAEHTEVICRNIEKADRTISALIDLGKPRAPEDTDIDLAELAREVLQLVSIESRRRKIALEVENTRSVRVKSDRRMLVQAVLNLVLNASQASSPGSTVVVAPRTFALAGQEWAVLAVEDRGHGLDPELRDKLFSPFFTTRTDGTGLGLLSARRIADELGGRLGLFPRGSGGARAVLLLPLERKSSTTLEAVS